MKKNYELKRTQTIVYIALITALITSVTIMTAFVFPNGGYFNLGDVVILLLATISPMRHILIAASLGSALADVLTGFVSYAVFTAFIKGAEVLVLCMFKRLLRTKWYPLPFFFSACTMLLGYGLVDSLILGNYAFFASIITNTPQAGAAFVIASLVYPWIRKKDFKIKGYLS